MFLREGPVSLLLQQNSILEVVEELRRKNGFVLIAFESSSESLDVSLQVTATVAIRILGISFALLHIVAHKS